MTASLPETKKIHFAHLDALRGVAALCVLVFHIAFSSALSPVWLGVVSPFVNTLGHVLAHGVEVFFVLSGWVIAHSMRRDSLTFSSLGRFLSRRALRLTPPYWAALLLSLAFGALAARLGSGDGAPSPQKIALNFVYLQNVSGAGNVFSPAWTLCIEAQFYLAFAAVLGLAHVLGPKTAPDERFGGARTPLSWLLFGSVVGTLGLALVWNNPALFLSWWFYFAAGALGYLSSRDAQIRPLIWLACAAMLGTSLWLGTHPVHHDDEGRAVFVGALCLGFLLCAQQRPKITNWGRAGAFEWLGRVSYSLYLTHFAFGLLVARALRKVAGHNAALAIAMIVLDLALCLVLAGVFWRFVERPAMAWASGFKMKNLGFETVLGLSLDAAREVLGEKVVVISSAPPFFPRGYTAHMGQERVVRARALADGRVELLVARELVGEERASSNDKSGGGKESAGR